MNGDYEFGDWTGRQLVTDEDNTFFQWLVPTVTVKQYTTLEDFNDLPDLLQRSASATETEQEHLKSCLNYYARTGAIV
jgi:hypothetical protein